MFTYYTDESYELLPAPMSIWQSAERSIDHDVLVATLADAFGALDPAWCEQVVACHAVGDYLTIAGTRWNRVA